MDQAPDFVLFLGRFHPLVVHLPIGFLFFAFVLEVFSRWKKNPTLTAAIPLALLLGGISAALSCILGYMLSLSGDYDASAVDTHFWLGIATTIVAFLAWLIRIEKVKIPFNAVKANISVLSLIVVLLSVTGHYGGNLTHGNDYLVKYAPFGKKEETKLVPVEKVEDAAVYSYLVNPILQNKCASCHNAGKKKGGLSFEDQEAILKGGKGGDVFVAGNAANSEMIKRVLLNPHHEDFMPPEGKTPLTEEETAILTYWIDKANADFNTKIAEVETPENIVDIASVMLGLKASGKPGEIPMPTVNVITDDVLNEIKAEGFRLSELAFESNLYDVVLPSQTINNPADLQQKLEKLAKIKDNILWLSLGDNMLEDKHVKVLQTFTNLQILKLNKNPITDKGVKALEGLKSIISLNLYGTKVTKNSLETFEKMTNLKKVYVWGTPIVKEEVESYSSKENYPEIIF